MLANLFLHYAFDIWMARNGVGSSAWTALPRRLSRLLFLIGEDGVGSSAWTALPRRLSRLLT